MSHEMSETVQKEDGMWYNVDQNGNVLEGPFSDPGLAAESARMRSADIGTEEYPTGENPAIDYVRKRLGGGQEGGPSLFELIMAQGGNRGQVIENLLKRSGMFGPTQGDPWQPFPGKGHMAATWEGGIPKPPTTPKLTA